MRWRPFGFELSLAAILVAVLSVTLILIAVLAATLLNRSLAISLQQTQGALKPCEDDGWPFHASARSRLFNAILLGLANLLMRFSAWAPPNPSPREMTSPAVISESCRL
jgi:hypothetical protein